MVHISEQKVHLFMDEYYTALREIISIVIVVYFLL